jgi:hypothetical protein
MQCVFGLITVFVLIISFQKSMYNTLPLKGLLISLVIITYLIVFHANVQSGTRFISTHPIFYLNLAHFLMQNNGKLNLLKIFIIFYFCVFTMFGLVFFPARFSWAWCYLKIFISNNKFYANFYYQFNKTYLLFD